MKEDWTYIKKSLDPHRDLPHSGWLAGKLDKAISEIVRLNKLLEEVAPAVLAWDLDCLDCDSWDDTKYSNTKPCVECANLREVANKLRNESEKN